MLLTKFRDTNNFKMNIHAALTLQVHMAWPPCPPTVTLFGMLFGHSIALQIVVYHNCPTLVKGLLSQLTHTPEAHSPSADLFAAGKVPGDTAHIVLACHLPLTSLQNIKKWKAPIPKHSGISRFVGRGRPWPGTMACSIFSSLFTYQSLTRTIEWQSWLRTL